MRIKRGLKVSNSLWAESKLRKLPGMDHLCVCMSEVGPDQGTCDRCTVGFCNCHGPLTDCSMLLTAPSHTYGCLFFCLFAFRGTLGVSVWQYLDGRHRCFVMGALITRVTFLIPTFVFLLDQICDNFLSRCCPPI